MAQGSVWAAGAGALDQFLVDREAKRMLDEDRARRTQLDDEARATRERSFGLQESELNFRRETTAASAAAAAAKAAEAKDTAAAAEARRNKLIAIVMDQRQDRNLRLMAGAELDAMDAGGATVQSVLNPKEDPEPTPFTLSPGQQRFGPDGKPIASVPDRPRVGGASREATPQQRLTAIRNARRDADLEFRDREGGLLGAGMSPEEKAALQQEKAERTAELEAEYLEALGEDPPARPTPSARPDPLLGAEAPVIESQPGADINLPLPSGGRGGGAGARGSAGPRPNPSGPALGEERIINGQSAKWGTLPGSTQPGWIAIGGE